MLTIAVANKDELNAKVARDPFAEHNLTENMTVTKWGPIFGAFSNFSSMRGSIQSRLIGLLLACGLFQFIKQIERCPWRQGINIETCQLVA